MISRSLLAAFVATGLLAGSPAVAQDSIKIAYIDPLSGPGATVGEVGLKTFQFLAEELNAKGGAAGKKFEILPFDNKTNPQESLVQVQKAVDAGARIITQGNGSSVAAALSDWVSKYNERNPGKEVLYLNYAAVDPVLTNEKCSFAHFRWDANSDIKMEALTNYMKGQKDIKKVYLINQDYSFGQAVRKAATEMLKAKRPDIQVVGDELHPLLKVTDFAPYIAKIKASGADTVITGNWSQDFALLLKAAADAGLQVNWVHLLCRWHRWPNLRQANRAQSSRLCHPGGFGQRRSRGLAGDRKGLPRQVRFVDSLPPRLQRDADAGGRHRQGQLHRSAQDCPGA
jgi:branched-chain amino acid transport system substrate-binding protein